MIVAKEAVRIAMEAMGDLYPEEQVPHLTLEEVELAKDGSTWNVIVSFSRSYAKSTIEAMTGQQGTTTYKMLVIDAETGEPLAAKKGLVEPKAGQVELAHFAVLSGSGWVSTDTHLAADTVRSVADTFANVWVRNLGGDRIWGRQLWECDSDLPMTQRCHGCR